MGYTKAQREANAKKKLETVVSNENVKTEEQIRAEIEAQIRAEMQEQYSQKETATEKKVETKRKLKIPLDLMIPCKSGVQGTLVYVSKRINGYEVEWNEYGEPEYIELNELVSMKNTSKAFFTNNWIFIDDTDEYSAQDIYEFLGVSSCYENIIMGEDIDFLFTKSPEEIKKIVAPLSKGVKATIALKAKQKIDSKELDSMNRISALDEVLDVELKPSF